MPAPKGNQFWKLRSKHGRDKIFSDPDVLWEECTRYFQYCIDNPLEEEKVFHSAGEITRTRVAKLRAMTLSGLCFFLKITEQTWGEYRKHKDFTDVVHEADQVMRTQKFEGAAAEMLNANIIARDLGLSDKSRVEHSVDKETISHAEKLAQARRRRQKDAG